MNNTKNKKPKKYIIYIKAAAGFLGYMIAAVGLMLFLSIASSSSKADFTSLYSAAPINGFNGLAVDSNGHILIGSAENSRIQVFSPNGEFLYGFSFPTSGGSFTFGIDHMDTIHVIVYRPDAYLQYKKDTLISSEKVDFSGQKYLEEEYQKTLNRSYEYFGKRYSLLGRRWLVIEDLKTNGKSTVRLNSSVWRLSVFQSWLLLVCGIGLISGALLGI